MSCSRWVSGGAFCRFWPMSCDAMAGALSRISTPLTRATVGSFGDAAAVAVGSCFCEDASFEQPATIGRASSATESMAKVVQPGRRAPSMGAGAGERCGAVIKLVLGARRLKSRRGEATAGGGSGRRVAQSALLGNGRIGVDFDENVSRNRQLTRG